MRKFMISITMGYLLIASSLYANPMRECGKALQNAGQKNPTLYDAKMCEEACRGQFSKSGKTGNKNTADYASTICFWSANYYESNKDYNSANHVISYMSSKGYSLEDAMRIMRRR